MRENKARSRLRAILRLVFYSTIAATLGIYTYGKLEGCRQDASSGSVSHPTEVTGRQSSPPPPTLSSAAPPSEPAIQSLERDLEEQRAVLLDLAVQCRRTEARLAAWQNHTTESQTAPHGDSVCYSQFGYFERVQNRAVAEAATPFHLLLAPIQDSLRSLTAQLSSSNSQMTKLIVSLSRFAETHGESCRLLLRIVTTTPSVPELSSLLVTFAAQKDTAKEQFIKKLTDHLDTAIRNEQVRLTRSNLDPAPPVEPAPSQRQIAIVQSSIRSYIAALDYHCRLHRIPLHPAPIQRSNEKPASELALELASKPASELASEPASEPVSEPTSEPVSELASILMAQHGTSNGLAFIPQTQRDVLQSALQKLQQITENQ